MSPTTLIVLAKRPEPGRVKTRLCPPLSPAQAADVAAAALADTIAAVTAVGVSRRLCFDGDPTGWLRTGWEPTMQCAGGLDARIAGAFGGLHGPAVLIGMDTPQVTPRQLRDFDPAAFDACLGRTDDGGYWAIGFRDPALAVRAVPGVPMSVPHTGREQLLRLRSLGLRVQLLEPLRDVDTVDDARAVAALVPGSDFAAAVCHAARRSA